MSEIIGRALERLRTASTWRSWHRDRRGSRSIGSTGQTKPGHPTDSYAGDLYHLVTVVEAMLRDPKLHEHGVRTHVLTIGPMFTDRVPAFEAAKVRLLVA